jgi:penicillin-binding protein 1A
VEEILAPDGSVVPLAPRASRKQVVSESVAYVVTSLMTSVVEEGTGKAVRVLKRPIAGKTGTSNDARDAWFAGYSTDLAAAVWVGYDDRKPLGAGESGGTTAAPIFVEAMRAAHQGRPATDFPMPTGVVRASIDRATGKLARADEPDALVEVFLEGTEPTETAPGEGGAGAGEGGGSAGDEASAPSADAAVPDGASPDPARANPANPEGGKAEAGSVAPPSEAARSGDDAPREEPPFELEETRPAR